MKNNGRGRCDRFNSSLEFLECNRRELSAPWNVGVEPAEERMNTRKLDPPDVNDGSNDRSKKDFKVKVASSKRPDPVARTTPPKLNSSRIHPTTTAARKDTSKSLTEEASSKTRVNTKHVRLYSRVKAESRKIVSEATKKLSRCGLYEEFPKRKTVRFEELHKSSLTCSMNEDSIFVDEMDWANSSVDWGFGT